MMDLQKVIAGLRALNEPNQGMSYHAGGVVRGAPKYDEYTGQRLVPTFRSIELNVYGERARFLYELIQNSKALAELLDDLIQAPTPETDNER